MLTGPQSTEIYGACREFVAKKLRLADDENCGTGVVAILVCRYVLDTYMPYGSDRDFRKTVAFKSQNATPSFDLSTIHYSIVILNLPHTLSLSPFSPGAANVSHRR